jgi:hypothetical protein
MPLRTSGEGKYYWAFRFVRPVDRKRIHTLGQVVRLKPYNSVIMRVPAPPSRCKSESVPHSSATGPQRAEAGVNGGIGKPPPEIPSSRSLWVAKAKTWLNHRQCQPA